VDQEVLLDIKGMLQSMGKNLKSFPLPDIDDTYYITEGEAREVIEETSTKIDDPDKSLASSLKPERRLAYDDILAAVDRGDGGVLFIDGPGGTGKTFLYMAYSSSMALEALGRPSCTGHYALFIYFLGAALSCHKTICK
jgi:ATP-dependent DNA helicase PIF1